MFPRSNSNSRPISEYVSRALSFSQMDFQSAFSQMISLLHTPGEIYKSTVLRKQIKNQWARDDPAFIVLLIYFIFAASISFCITFGVSSIWHFLRIVAGSVFIEFFAIGLAIASFSWWMANKYMIAQRIMSVEQEVEWLYCFDIHCNGFFPVFLLLFVVQFFLSPLLLRMDLLATIFANSLYAFAFSYYYYISFLGYKALPFLHDTQRFLYPIGIIVLIYFVTVIFNVNLSRVILGLYFS
eukprot:TRINITY_DN10277_c0_g1_i1.p1 TRINITY_DN10277_c0_g1~~TRINITY_DN10277_c0_g1_i1.p1  ORF type:complete len:240 (-),score=20.21 TRINITY_DN10277_c0_g1_i1:52-771(-)